MTSTSDHETTGTNEVETSEVRDTNRGRLSRFIASVACLALVGLFLTAICDDALQISFPIIVALYTMYLIVQGSLITLLAGQLYRQHEIRELRFGIGNLMVLTSMIALPLGLSSVIQHMGVARDDGFASTGVGFAIGLSLYFVLLPLLLSFEAVAVWIRRSRKS